MPGFDGTGPEGRGPMTGGARGSCNPNVDNHTPTAAPAPPAYGRRRPVYGRGRPRWGLRGFLGRGFRSGRGRRGR